MVYKLSWKEEYVFKEFFEKKQKIERTYFVICFYSYRKFNHNVQHIGRLRKNFRRIS